MGESMYVHATELRSTGPHFDLIADGIEDAMHRLASVLDAQGMCWGADAMGSAFGSAYAPAASRVREAFPVLHDGVADVAAAVRQTADTAAAADGRASTRLV